MKKFILFGIMCFVLVSCKLKKEKISGYIDFAAIEFLSNEQLANNCNIKYYLTIQNAGDTLELNNEESRIEFVLNLNGKIAKFKSKIYYSLDNKNIILPYERYRFFISMNSIYYCDKEDILHYQGSKLCEKINAETMLSSSSLIKNITVLDFEKPNNLDIFIWIDGVLADPANVHL